MVKLNEIADRPGARAERMRVGRGIGSGKGKTGGRGVKGQKARSGVAIKGFEGGQMPIHRRLPKRGFNNPFGRELNELNFNLLEQFIAAGRIDVKKEITSASLLEAGVFSKALDGVKLLAKGTLKSKVTIKVEAASASALAAVEKLGGKVILPQAAS